MSHEVRTEYHPACSPMVPVLPGPALGTYLVGSTAIYGSGKDVDHIVLVGDHCAWAATAVAAGWTSDSSYPCKEAKFVSLRQSNVNLIVTHNTWLFEAFLAATDVMKKLAHVVPQAHKAKRVMLYELFQQWHEAPDVPTIR